MLEDIELSSILYISFIYLLCHLFFTIYLLYSMLMAFTLDLDLFFIFLFSIYSINSMLFIVILIPPQLFRSTVKKAVVNNI